MIKGAKMLVLDWSPLLPYSSRKVILLLIHVS